MDNHIDSKNGNGEANPLETVVMWPRGKYNGRRIVGFSIKFKLDVLNWLWRPRISLKHMKYAHWLCFRLHFETNYD